MTGPAYADFQLSIDPVESGKYRVRVIESPAGERSALIDWPFSELEIENVVLRIGQTRRGTRSAGSQEERYAQEFGQRLFSAVFPDPIRELYLSSLRQAREENKAGLRLRLQFGETPDLLDIPWEYLYSGELIVNRFLARSSETPIVRFLELGRRVDPLPLSRPLRVLVAVSRPPDLPELDVEKEWANLLRAVKEPREKGHIEVDRLDPPTVAELQQCLMRSRYHIFHFIGHGRYDEVSGQGSLFFEDENGKAHEVETTALDVVLSDYHQHLRLVILNSCEGARATRTDPFSGTAQSLIQQGISAVVAMQFEITDEASVSFAQGFYSALAAGYPVDRSVSEGRKAIYLAGNDVEWGTPCLYTQVSDSSVFELPTLVPYVVGKTQGDAASLIEEAGLTIGTTTERHDDRVPQGRVVESVPKADTEVDDAALVNVVLSLGSVPISKPAVGESKPERVSPPEPDGAVPSEAGAPLSPEPARVLVPTLVGLDRAEAFRLLEETGLNLAKTTKVRDRSARDAVVQQGPIAGTEAALGSRVELRVSGGRWYVSPRVLLAACGVVAAVLVALLLLWLILTREPWCPQEWSSFTWSGASPCP